MTLFNVLLVLHSVLRWLVPAALVYVLYRGVQGRTGRLPFTKADNTLRHLSATLAHIQMTIGWVLYFESPVATAFRHEVGPATEPLHPDDWFFGLIHPILMTASVVLVTIGSSLAKRQATPQAKFRTLAVWYGLGLVLLLVAVPWPFSPLAVRPWVRWF